jgi:glycosyltransferase involved in cell wall biosynthesis
VKSLAPLIVTGGLPPDIGGSATYADFLVRGLPTRGIQPGVLNFADLLAHPTGVRHLILLRRILSTGARHDTVFALDPVSTGLPSLLAARAIRRRFILRVGGDFAWEQATERFGVSATLDQFQGDHWGLRPDLLAWIQRFVARSADLVITPSQYMRGVVRHWGVAERKVAVVANGVEPSGDDLTRPQARLALGMDGPLVVSMGRLVRFKGFAALIRAIADLQPARPGLRLLLIGGGPRADELASQVTSLGLHDRVELTGVMSRRQVQIHLRAADVFVLNSAGEGQSHALLEAMAAETPVVASRVPGNLELIEHGESGLLVACNDRHALVQAIDRLLTDRALAGSLARAGRRIADRHTIRKTVDGTLLALAGVQ